jgi:hypothetical protein
MEYLFIFKRRKAKRETPAEKRVLGNCAWFLLGNN